MTALGFDCSALVQSLDSDYLSWPFARHIPRGPAVSSLEATFCDFLRSASSSELGPVFAVAQGSRRELSYRAAMAAILISGRLTIHFSTVGTSYSATMNFDMVEVDYYGRRST